MRSISPATPIILDSEERAALDALANSRRSEARMRDRARIVLLAAGIAGDRPGGWLYSGNCFEVERALRQGPPGSPQRNRFEALSRATDRSTTDVSWRCSIRRRRCVMRTGRHRCWRRELGDIHEQYIWRFLRALKIDRSRRKSWCESNDPDFVAKAASVST